MDVNDSLKEQTTSYLDVRFHSNEGDLYSLRVPTLWDPIKNLWLACLILPESKHIIKAHGKDSKKLQDNFLKAATKVFKKDDPRGKELFKMFEKR